jgi:hypothetical protein
VASGRTFQIGVVNLRKRYARNYLSIVLLGIGFDLRTILLRIFRYVWFIKTSRVYEMKDLLRETDEGCDNQRY